MSDIPALTKRDAEFAVNYLKEFADNIRVAIEVFIERAPTAPVTNQQIVHFAPTFRMSFSWIALTLSKTVEFWDGYGRFAAGATKNEMRVIKREIVDRGIVKFRDRTVAHLFNRESGDPFTPEELQEEAMAIMRHDMERFFQWLGDPRDLPRTSVCATLLRFRAEILEKYPDTRVTN